MHSEGQEPVFKIISEPSSIALREKESRPIIFPQTLLSHATIKSPNAAGTKSRSPKPAAWTQCESTPDLTFAITASLARAAMRGSLSDGRNDYKSRRQKRAVYTPLRSINVCSRANQTAACARAPEQHTQTQQSLRDDLLKDSAAFSGGAGG